MSTNYITQIKGTDNVTYDINEGVDTRIFRATCIIAAGTAAKVATLDDATNFSLAVGVRVAVTFQYGNSAATPTLNVNSSGAKTIAVATSATAFTTGNGTTYNTWGPYETIIFTYNGTYWVRELGRAIYNAYANTANQNAYRYVKVGSTSIDAGSTTGTIELVPGDNVALTPDATNKKVTIKATPNSMVETIQVNAWGRVSIPSGKMAQGMTTDGTYLYMAAISTSDGVSNPTIFRHQISTNQAAGSKNPSKKGHYNNLNYYSNYIYATGFNTQDVNDDYSQIYKYSYSNNTGTTYTTSTWYWNFAIGTTAYNTKYYIGLVASRHAYDIYTLFPGGPTGYLPFTRSPIEFGNGTEQGCCIWERPSPSDSSIKYKYILTILTDPRSFGSEIHGGQEILITSLTGRTVKRLVLDLPYYEELEDICVVGNTVYFNSSNGRIYKIDNLSPYVNYYWEDYKPIMFQKPCFLYINANGSEVNDNGTYGSSSGTLLREFGLSPMVEENLIKSGARGMFVFRGISHIPFCVNPSSNGNITIEFNCIDGAYTYDFRLFYQRSSQSTHWKYSLASIRGGYRNANGVLTTFDVTDFTISPGSSYKNLLDNVFYTGLSYVHHIISDPTVEYTFETLNI